MPVLSPPRLFVVSCACDFGLYFDSNDCYFLFALSVAMSSAAALSNLYKASLKEAGNFVSQNLRAHAKRRVEYVFAQAQKETDPQALAKFVAKAETDLLSLERQVCCC